MVEGGVWTQKHMPQSEEEFPSPHLPIQGHLIGTSQRSVSPGAGVAPASCVDWRSYWPKGGAPPWCQGSVPLLQLPLAVPGGDLWKEEENQ